MNRTPQKILILKFVVEQGIATLEDIRQYLNLKEDSGYLRVALYKLGVSHLKYGKIPHGIWFVGRPELIGLLKSYYRDLPLFPTRRVHLHLVPHSLGMNRIRTILEKSQNIMVSNWWSEHYIRSLAPDMRFGILLSKIPDAIFWRSRNDSSQQKFFLEYERTLKSKARYIDLFRYYANRQDVQNRNVIYICENDTIKAELEKIEQFLVKTGRLENVGICFQFITFENFCQQYAINNQIKEEERLCAG